MNIYVNDEETQVAADSTLQSFLSSVAAGNLAVAVNETVIAQDQWSGYTLQENDRVLLIAPVQGG